MPTTFTAVVIFAVLLLPGLTYVYEVERRKVTPKLSSFRETSLVLMVSMINFVVASVLVLIFAAMFPGIGEAVDLVLRSRESILLSNPRAALAWLVGYLIVATLVTGMSAYFNWWGKIRTYITGREAIFQVAGWAFAQNYKTDMTEYDANVLIRATVYLKSGSSIRGQVLGHTSSTEDDQQASITLGRPLHISDSGGARKQIADLDKVVIHSNEISYVGFEIKKPKM
ncbi:DUF6338 family protein [Glutamicibacter nicotianae]|uniref:DUF6338 family protein n=1 Tax=Glutamicibacter nicotianae TaxID=37929 RepID=UPI00195F029D|nr:DUF6338 family protein [Glutamicibacter nicotianae]MBM7767346.1 hypothetical protein [Glutamicibacter nicotianae]